MHFLMTILMFYIVTLYYDSQVHFLPNSHYRIACFVVLLILNEDSHYILITGIHKRLHIHYLKTTINSEI